MILVFTSKESSMIVCLLGLQIKPSGLFVCFNEAEICTAKAESQVFVTRSALSGSRMICTQKCYDLQFLQGLLNACYQHLFILSTAHHRKRRSVQDALDYVSAGSTCVHFHFLCLFPRLLQLTRESKTSRERG